ncbi:max-binding protein MNT [Anabrus simplex]|uniref:max-binding protein MNT n=1 Tax=Anabrus simplex TaxID=316456 RepID=UPI0035A3BCD6
MQLAATNMGVLVINNNNNNNDSDTLCKDDKNGANNNINNKTSCWMPPPKKKWIRHYLLEEEEEQFPSPPSPPQQSSPTLLQPLHHVPPLAAVPAQRPAVPHVAAAGATPAVSTNGSTTAFSHLLEPAPSLPLSLQGQQSQQAQQGSGDDVTNKDFQRRAAGTREVHNKLEKNRRAHLKECFELLKKQLPASQDEKKSSNLSILHSALRYIQSLRRKERELEHEMERLAREKIAAQQRLANLKKDLSAQWDHIDFSTLLPESQVVEDPRARDHVSHTTSTASEREELMSDSEEPLTKCGVIYSSTSSLSSAPTASSPPQPSELHGHGGEGPKPPPPTTLTTPTQHHVQLPVSAHMVSAGPGLAAALVSPTIQLLTPSGLRMLPTDPQPLALTVHHTQAPQLPTTTCVTSHHRMRDSPDIRTTAAISVPTLHLTNKAVTLAEAARLPGGAELNILPANGTIRSTSKHHPITLTGGLALPNGVLSHAGVTLTTKSMPLSLAHGPVSGITHVVAPLGSHPAGLTPIVTPVTVVSQGNQVAHILATPQPIGGKMMTTTPLLKSVGPMPVMSAAQYLSEATLVKPVVVVSSASALPPHTNT